VSPVDPFCSPFDAVLAADGPPALFLRDPEGLFRFDPEWTRDAWGRSNPVERRWCWVLARDRDSGYVQIVLATSPDLVADHPRLQLRVHGTLEAASEALARLGRPPLARDPW
jgi:hypothetical protein